MSAAARQRWLGAAVVLAVASGIGSARAEYVVAPDVVVFCDLALEHAITDAARLWRRESEVPVRVFAAPTPLLVEQVSRHIRSDLLIGEGDRTAAVAVERQALKTAPRLGLWRNRLVLARRRAEPPAEGALSAMLAAGPVALVDLPSAVAAVDTRQALERLGLWEGVAPNILGSPDTADAAFLLRHGKARFAVVYATDVAADSSLTKAAALPDDAYPPVTYWLAETTTILSPEAAKFEAFLTQPAAQQQLREDGLEVLP